MIFKQRRTFRLALRFAAIVIGVALVYVADVLVQESLYGWGALVAVGLAAIAAFEVVFADYLAASRDFPKETEVRLARMVAEIGSETVTLIQQRLRAVILEFKNCDTKQISAAVHVVTELTDNIVGPEGATAREGSRIGLLQLTDYVGPAEHKKGSGRIFLVTQGVIGRCVRTGKLERVNFSTADEYTQSMVSHYGYSSDEAAKHTMTARSYLAYPILDGAYAVGSLYFYSTEAAVFTEVNEERLTLLAEEVRGYLLLSKLKSKGIRIG